MIVMAHFAGGDDLSGPSVWSGGASSGFLQSAVSAAGERAHPTAPILSVQWHGFDSAVELLVLQLPSALQYDVCVGTTPFGCQLRGFGPADSNHSWQGHDLPLRCGSTYSLCLLRFSDYRLCLQKSA